MNRRRYPYRPIARPTRQVVFSPTDGWVIRDRYGVPVVLDPSLHPDPQETE